MLLAIDVGNTSVKLGIFKNNDLLVTWHLASSVSRMPDEYAAIFLSLLQNKGLKPSDVTDSCISSVVPPIATSFEDVLQRYFGIKPLMVGAGTKTGVRIRYENPAELGADRIVQAAAAHQLYGGPLIILDMGTATVFDTVNKDGDYLGGALAPGINIAAEALVSRAHTLPRVKLAHPKKVIGSNTTTAMQSGIIFGYVGLIEGVVARIWKELGDKGKVVATGGYADLIARETKVIDIINPDLILTGLRLIYAMNVPAVMKNETGNVS